MSSLFPKGVTAKPQSEADWIQLDAHASQIFSPHTPVDEQELFSGRFELIQRLVDVVLQEGQHAVLFGQRGVGKSSLANIIKEKIFARHVSFNVIKRNCTTNHNFKLIWQHVFSDFDYGGTSAPLWLEEHHNPFDIYQLAQAFSSNSRPIFIIDEFDRIHDRATKVMMSDTIKYLSDYGAKATIIIVGVAKDVRELFLGHESITRNIDQILMPNMDHEELEQILSTRFGLLQMKAPENVVQSLVALSQGLPGYTHLMGRDSVRAAIKRRSLELSIKDLGEAINRAIDISDETIKGAYANAIRSTKPQNQYRQALLACALARTDDRGFLTAASIRAPFSKIMGRTVDIPSFARHLKEFCDERRGPALVKEGTPKNYEYRFYEPLLRPYVVIRGVGEGLIKSEDLGG